MGHRCISQKPVEVKISPSMAVRRQLMRAHSQPPLIAPSGISAVRRSKARTLSIGCPPNTVAMKSEMLTIAMISAAPTRKLTNALAEKGQRVKRESSTIGNTRLPLDPLRLFVSSERAVTHLRSRYTSRAINAAINIREAPISQGLFCIGAWLELDSDVAIAVFAASWESPALKQINAAPNKSAPGKSIRALLYPTSAVVTPGGMRRQMKKASIATMGRLRKKIACQLQACTMIAPYRGPKTPPASVTIPIRPRARERCFSP